MSTLTQLETNEQYHADHSHVSHSMLSVFRQSRRVYRDRFVSRTQPPPEQTAAMRLGTLVHLAILEPDVFATQCRVAPIVDRRTKAGKEIAAQFEAENSGKIIITNEENEITARIVEAVESSTKAKQLLVMDGDVETSIRWRDRESGIKCKCRPDKFSSSGLIIDLKTTRDASPRGFARSCAALGYHRQAAWYLDGAREVLDANHNFAFIAVETAYPWTVAVYELDRDAIELGRNENRTAIMQVRDCMRSGDWREPHEKRVNLLSLPKWSVYANEWDIIE